MAGYSGTPLPQKLGIKPGYAVAFAGAPPSFAAALGELPPNVEVRDAEFAERLDVAVFFTMHADELEGAFRRFGPLVAPAGSLWIAWPKRASGMPTDVSENVVRDVGLACGMVDVKVCAIDETWSGLKFVYRLKDRPR
ncbi:MAG: hypothetical protein JWM27_2397 [Gemmatimonadetes bacterium]|nr:hypothetical protein [Gemmatimonadota bacterium]